MPRPRDQLVEALTTHVLHHDEVEAIDGLDLVNGDDVRMIEGRGGVRFLHEAATPIAVADAICG